MPALSSYDYALIRVVPSVERGECLNVGVILFCRVRRFLGIRFHIDSARLLALAPDLDLSVVQHHLETLSLICQGSKEAGLLGQLSQSERFHWLVAPHSTIIQPSPAHSGLCTNPEETLQHLLKTMVCR